MKTYFVRNLLLILFCTCATATCCRAGIGENRFSVRQYFIPEDSIKKVKPLHSPKKAALMSALVPGLGQIYNKKYWKLPIVYAGMGGTLYGVLWNHKYFKYYRTCLRARYDLDSSTIDPLPLYPDDVLVTYKNYYQRYRDLCFIGMAAVYTLQILDAAVDAHLFYFDVGPDLSFHWLPEVRGDAYGPTCGLSFGLTFQ